MPTLLTYSFELDAAEVVRASQAIEKRARRPGPTLLLFGAVFAVPVIAAVNGSFGAVVRPYLLIMVAIFLVALAWPFVQRRRLHGLFANTPSFQGPQTYRLGEENLELSTPLAQSHVRWDALVEVAETEEFFLFYFSKKRAYYLPKVAVGGPEDQEKLRQVIEARVGARAHVGEAALGAPAPNDR